MKRPFNLGKRRGKIELSNDGFKYFFYNGGDKKRFSLYGISFID